MAAIVIMPLCVILVVFGRFFYRWNQFNKAGIRVTLQQLIGMNITKTDSPVIFDALFRLQRECGEGYRLQAVQAHFLAGGRPMEMVEAYLFLKNHQIQDAWMKACAMDLMAKFGQPPRPALELVREKLPSLRSKSSPVSP